MAGEFNAEDLPTMAPKSLGTTIQSSCCFGAIRTPLPITRQSSVWIRL
ncbi:hypothetical protein GGR08_001274 [Bartonella fuyuanensis]|uniref:Uncharacterized protein n=1 Tax=Bartonella fuyuanensis TaxID=1460968 RepID=A0A840E592_9HYPH|nr:hypothetical protein [Bartonella fuyuanensis]MBB4076959.1 hypothetical protein [Bartonella fuyuanensis]